MENCYIFEDENIGVIGVMACTEDGARYLLSRTTNAIAQTAILLDCISEDDELFDDMLDSYGCDVL
jgi:hypothetical protein